MDDLLRVIRQIDREGATFGTSGNASARRDREAFFITPSGVPWPDMLVIVTSVLPSLRRKRGIRRCTTK